MPPPLSYQRLTLPMRSVLIRCLDEDRNPIPGAFGSGFIREEHDHAFLYTCWHVVTGYDPNDTRTPRYPPKQRMFLEVALQNAEKEQPGIERIGGLKTVVLSLYTAISGTLAPQWYQDRQDVPHADLNGIGLRVPFWHDVVKVSLPADIGISKVQAIDEECIFRNGMSLLAPGDRVLVVGYPYGFSVVGKTQPTPIVLTRYIAATRVADRHRQFLLESIGAPGMSGGPVFVERDENLLLVGLYTGCIYPDSEYNSREKTTALGTACDLSLVLWNALSLDIPACPDA